MILDQIRLRESPASCAGLVLAMWNCESSEQISCLAQESLSVLVLARGQKGPITHSGPSARLDYNYHGVTLQSKYMCLQKARLNISFYRSSLRCDASVQVYWMMSRTVSKQSLSYNINATESSSHNSCNEQTFATIVTWQLTDLTHIPRRPR